MHASLKALPITLLNHLGACSRLDTLIESPQVTVPSSTLRQHQRSEPYHVAIDAQGVTLTLQCTNPNVQPDEHLWGLHGITLSASTWNSGWPTGLNPREATADDVLALFTPNPEEVMNMDPMLCFAIEGVAGQTWSVMAMFDASGKKLSSFSLIRVGEWRQLEQPLNATGSA
ncbi:MAG: hypothetical protein HEQ39_08370 [Rhizobacter sp.]